MLYYIFDNILPGCSLRDRLVQRSRNIIYADREHICFPGRQFLIRYVNNQYCSNIGYMRLV